MSLQDIILYACLIQLEYRALSMICLFGGFAANCCLCLPTACCIGYVIIGTASVVPKSYEPIYWTQFILDTKVWFYFHALYYSELFWIKKLIFQFHFKRSTCISMNEKSSSDVVVLFWLTTFTKSKAHK